MMRDRLFEISALGLVLRDMYRGPKKMRAAMAAFHAAGLVVVPVITLENASACLRNGGADAAKRMDSSLAHWMSANADELDRAINSFLPEIEP